MQIADAGDRLRFEQPEQFQHALAGFRCNGLTEIDQQRLIAGGLESRNAGRSWAHANASIRYAALRAVP